MVQVVWFKRDLRVHDHAPLAAAARAGPVLALFVTEPALWLQPDMAGRHLAFQHECLESLKADLARMGLQLVTRTGAVPEILADIHAATPITALHSHEETGNGWTYERDKAVARWCRAHGIAWHEKRQFGVIRPDNDRDRWARRWEDVMTSPLASLPDADTITAAPAARCDPPPGADALGLAPDPCPGRQPGGRLAALDLLDSFFANRGRTYHRAMSSPRTATEACSRLSPHLALGTVSLREVVQRAYHERLQLAEMTPQSRPMDLRACDAFIARLHWHCHFIQKLEDEPEIEHQAFHPAFEKARPSDSEDSAIRLQAWSNGRTGWPFVDACMRCLDRTGWINFRMRAMLMAVASYHLWLDWRQSGLVLARRFTDYEPGIHWSQVQMQSGNTAINTLRIYNPVKQSKDQDPDGDFIRRWVPELANVPNSHIHEPWTMPPLMQRELGVVIGETYPAPIRDHLQAAREARARIGDIRKQPGFRDVQHAILKKHGSRKGTGRGRNAFPRQDRMMKAEKEDRQMKLDL